VSEVVLFDVEDGVATLTLNRPERLNAWTAELGRAYFDRLDECAAREDVRAIVVTGAGRGFCAGADMKDLQSIGSGDLDGARADQDPRPQTHALTVPKPVIAGRSTAPAPGWGWSTRSCATSASPPRGRS
jgi:enoyl-CoA hydratase/carnithine racemase